MGEAWSNQLIQLLVLTLSGGYTGIFGYSPSPGPGNLVLSITNQPGTDPYGNPYPAGITVGSASQPQIAMSAGNPSTLNFPLNDTDFGQSTILYSAITAGPPKFASFVIDGPSANLVSHRDYIEVQLNSANLSGSSFANMGFLWFNGSQVGPGNVGTFMGYMDASGWNFLKVNTLAATVPGTGTTVFNPGQQETWHTLPLDAGWTVQAGYPAPQYRYLPTGDLQLTGVAFASYTTSAGKNLNNSNPLPAGYRPAHIHDWRTGDLIGSRCHTSLATNGIITGYPPTGATFTANYYCDIEGVVSLQLSPVEVIQ